MSQRESFQLANPDAVANDRDLTNLYEQDLGFGFYPINHDEHNQLGTLQLFSLRYPPYAKYREDVLFSAAYPDHTSGALILYKFIQILSKC
jgi:hypothetical protein